MRLIIHMGGTSATAYESLPSIWVLCFSQEYKVVLPQRTERSAARPYIEAKHLSAVSPTYGRNVDYTAYYWLPYSMTSLLLCCQYSNIARKDWEKHRLSLVARHYNVCEKSVRLINITACLIPYLLCFSGAYIVVFPQRTEGTAACPWKQDT